MRRRVDLILCKWLFILLNIAVKTGVGLRLEYQNPCTCVVMLITVHVVQMYVHLLLMLKLSQRARPECVNRISVWQCCRFKYFSTDQNLPEPIGDPAKS